MPIIKKSISEPVLIDAVKSVMGKIKAKLGGKYNKKYGKINILFSFNLLNWTQ